MVRCKGKACDQLSGGWINCSHATAMAYIISGEIFAKCAVNLCRLFFHLRQSTQKMPLISYFLIRNLGGVLKSMLTLNEAIIDVKEG